MLKRSLAGWLSGWFGVSGYREAAGGGFTRTSVRKPGCVLGFAAAVALLVPEGKAAETLRLETGETKLAEIGLARVGWQSYGKDVMWMPPGWQGHFDEATGVSCQSAGVVSGRDALLMHSPWRVNPGRTFVEYPLVLPDGVASVLEFGIAMGPGQVGPAKSDGVTFSCEVDCDGKTTPLLRKHHDGEIWSDQRFDLSAFAGKEIVLRLQVEPGPANNSAFDFSYFGNPRIVAGAAGTKGTDPVERILASRAYQATAGVSRAALSNSPRNGVVPSNLLPFTNTLASKGDAWQFRYEAADGNVEWIYQPRTGTLDDLTVSTDGGQPFAPAIGGGVMGGGKAPALLRDAKLIEARKDGGALRCGWEYALPGGARRVDWTLRIVGKALSVSVAAQGGDFGGFSLGRVGMVPLRRNLAIPYFEGDVCYLPASHSFVSRMLDWTASNASKNDQGTAVYDFKTDGTRNSLSETGFVTVSADIGEVFPNIPFAPSPYLEKLAPRVMLDVWGHHGGGYAGDAAKLRELKDNGVDHLAIIQHDWQRYGYDAKLPDHIPANPAYGGEPAMREYGRAANECGYLWSLHENYIDLYPDAPSYDPEARVIRADGTPSPAWYNEGTKVQSFGLKCDRALGFARANSPAIHAAYGTTAAYLDVHTCVPPWHQLDHAPGAPMSAMARAKVKFDSELFQFERDTHGGPLFGEGANHFYWAGRCDGVEAQVRGGEDHSCLLDFDLLKIHPQMVNHGMGYLERWFRRGYEARYGYDAGSVEQLDKYRAMEVAYGHAGFLGHRYVHNVQAVVREHHLVHPLQRLYGVSKPVAIDYETGGRYVTASAALAVGDTTHQRIRYENGLTVWVNWRSEPWRVEDKDLPQWGFLAKGPDTEVHTANHGTAIGDFAACPEYVFADARTWFDLPYRNAPVRIEPRLRDFAYLGGDRVRVTYEWRVGEPPNGDYGCFVHATNPAADNSDRIVFQGDHALPKPTGQWQPGDVIVDGPHELSVRPDFERYDLTIGLFRDDRLSLLGNDDGKNRIVVASLNVARKDGRITGVTATPAKPSEDAKRQAGAADFITHTNPPGTWVDFGSVATDGAVKINREAAGLVLFPYPRDRRFRVSLDLKSLAPAADPATLKIRALEAGDQRDLGEVPFKVDGGRITLETGVPGAGRYVIGWR